MKVVFLDRDGTLIREPHDFRIDALDKLVLLPGVAASLRRLMDAGYKLVIVSNQDGLGRPEFPQAHFDVPHQHMLALFAEAGVQFEAVFVDSHYEHEQHPNRKPNTGLVLPFIARHEVDLGASYMVGDRRTDALFAANLGVRSLTIKDPDSNDGDVRCLHIAPQPTVTFTHWQPLADHILGEGRR
jgi:imidazoleglycerol-phosphate dehydratase/histidinol-phosphatase